jgi:hypothetical protein
MAGWVTILGSAAVVLTVFDLIANLRSIDTRERVQKALSEPPLDGTGIDLQTVLSIMHVTAMVAAGCATAAIVLGWHVLRRNRGARMALTVLAVPLFLAGLITGGSMSSMVAVAVIMLWTRTAREWFDGRVATPPGFGGPPNDSGDAGGDGRAGRGAGPDVRQDAPTPPPSSGPPPFSGFGRPPGGEDEQGEGHGPEHGPEQGQVQGPPQGQQPWGPPPQQPWGPPQQTPPQQPPWQQVQPWQQQPWPGTAAPYATPRPREVLTASLLTWICTGVVAFGMLLVMAGFLLDPSIVDEMYSSDQRFADAGLTADQLRTWSLGLAAVFGAWSLAAAMLAVFAFLGHGWARVLLVVSAVAAALLTLLMVVAAPVVLLLTLPTVATVVLLTRPSVNAWYAHRASLRSGRGA